MKTPEEIIEAVAQEVGCGVGAWGDLVEPDRLVSAWKRIILHEALVAAMEKALGKRSEPKKAGH